MPSHPHAFPLVATRPPTAPWVNPPLRSLRWVETMLAGLAKEGFSDEQVLFTYRTFNGFLLGHLLLETSAMTLRDPKPGDGSFAAADTAASESEPGRAAAADPVPGGLGPARSAGQREAVEDADSPLGLIDPADVDARRFPTVHRLAGGLAQDIWEQEFESGLAHMLDRIAMLVADGPGPRAGNDAVSRGRCLPAPSAAPARPEATAGGRLGGDLPARCDQARSVSPASSSDIRHESAGLANDVDQGEAKRPRHTPGRPGITGRSAGSPGASLTA